MRMQRLNNIVQYVNQHGAVSFSTLCRQFNISSATMRRDLKALEEENRLKRVHGGARSIQDKQTFFETPYQKRLFQNVEEKKRIAREAFRGIQNNEVIILDSSTTNCELANLLAYSELKIMVITNDIHIGCILQEHPSIELLQVGGLIRPTFYSTMGHFAEDMLKQINAGKVFLGVDAIDAEIGGSIFHLDEANCKQLMIRQAKKRIVLCDHTKFNGTAVSPICPIDKIDQIITDSDIEQRFIDEFSRHRHIKFTLA